MSEYELGYVFAGLGLPLLVYFVIVAAITRSRDTLARDRKRGRRDGHAQPAAAPAQAQDPHTVDVTATAGVQQTWADARLVMELVGFGFAFAGFASLARGRSGWASFALGLALAVVLPGRLP